MRQKIKDRESRAAHASKRDAVHPGGMIDISRGLSRQNVIWLNDPDDSLESSFDVSRAPTTIVLDKEDKKAHLLIGLNLYSKRTAEKMLEALAK